MLLLKPGDIFPPLVLRTPRGAFINPHPAYLQSTGFVLDPFGKVVVSVCSSGAVGRLVPDDVIGLVRYVGSNSN